MSRLKFTIHGFQQQKLMEIGLDNNDALVMSVIKDMYASASIESLMIEDERYIWVNQTQLREFVPIIGSLRTIQRVFEKLRKAKVFDTQVIHEKKGIKGTFYFIKPTQLFDDLTEYVVDVNIPLPSEGTTKCHRGVRQNDVEGSDKMAEGGTTKCRNKDSSTNDSSTSNSTSSYDREELLQKWNEVAPVKMRKIVAGGPIDKSIKARIADYGIDGLYEAIDRIPKSSFLSGKVVNQKTGKLWKMTFSWFIGPQNFEKVYNGNYPEDEEQVPVSEFGNGGYGEIVAPKFDFGKGDSHGN